MVSEKYFMSRLNSCQRSDVKRARNLDISSLSSLPSASGCCPGRARARWPAGRWLKPGVFQHKAARAANIQSSKRSSRKYFAVGKIIAHGRGVHRVLRPLASSKNLQRAEVPVGGKGRHRAENQSTSTTLRWARPPP